MEYSFDILIAGGSTDCRHCYVDGSPGLSTAVPDGPTLAGRHPAS